MARFFAERGTRLGTLELLMASQTVWGTFESQVLLKSFTILGANLFFLWALSPIGGQASLRLLEFGNMTLTNSSRIVFLPTGGMSESQFLWSSAFTDNSRTKYALVDSLYNAAVYAPVVAKNSSQDQWGNVKIPWLDVADNSTADAEGWMIVPTLNTSDSYSALVGIPIAGIPLAEQTDFEITSTYMTLDCPYHNNKVNMSSTFFNDHLGIFWGPENGTLNMFGNSSLGTRTTFFMDTNLPFYSSRVIGITQDQNDTSREDPELQIRRNILFASEYWLEDAEGTFITMRNCTLASKYVDSKVRCSQSNCAVQQMRPSPQFSHRNPLVTPMDLNEVAYYVMTRLPTSTGEIHVGDPGDATPTEKYICGAINPNDMWSPNDPLGFTPITNVSYEVFNTRFGSVLNTYFQISMSPASFLGSLPDVSVFGPSGNGSYPNGTQLDTAPFVGMPVNATSSINVKIYRCNFLWLALSEASSAVMLIVGISGLILKVRCRAPDMMGYVASMTYDNPYVVLPPGGCTIGAMERARLLKNLEVRIGDVKMNEDVGHIAFVTLRNGQEKEIGRLTRDKRYC